MIITKRIVFLRAEIAKWGKVVHGAKLRAWTDRVPSV